MSIFKSTLKEYLANQIKARQNLLATQGERPIQFQQYVSGKSPWAKMTSFVDFDNSPNLANYHILFGGALSPVDANNTKNYFLRSGISVKGASYGSNLGTSQYGIRPMPGVESISVKSLGAYGSLRESTVKYYAWDVKQLENLNILFMHPGYPVLLEWGWSMYLDDKSNIIKSDFQTIDCFAPNMTVDGIQERIDFLHEKYRGNYDGSLGLIKNYSYTMLPNGGFECTTTIISVGDVIGSIKMNPTATNNTVTTTPGTTEQKEVKDQFEILMTDLANRNDSGMISTKFYDIDVKISNIGLANPSSMDTTIYSFGQAAKQDNLPDKDDRYTKYVQLAYFIHVLNNRTNLFTEGGQTIAKIEIPLNGVSGNLGNGLCVSSYNSMTIDNSVCIIKNSKATLIDSQKGFNPNVGKFVKGYVYQDINNANSATQFQTISNLGIPGIGGGQTPGNNTVTTTSQNPQFTQRELADYLYSNTNLGIIGNIYVNIGKIISIYKSIHKDSDGYVNLGDFLKELMSSIQYTLGSINSFDFYVNNNRGVIIDKHYVEDPADSKYSSKFVFNILGTDTIVRDHKLTSKIFQEQATMIAIAAQDRENIASIQTSTMVSINKRLYNRLYKNVDNGKNSDEAAKQNEILQNTQTLLSYVKNYIVTGETPTDSEITVTSLNTFLNELLVIADRGTDYKGIIPLSLELTIDGAGGFTIGEIFTINKDVLPAMYYDKRIGFIITGISQNLNRSDWTTTLTTQFCLLDQEERQEASKELSKKYLGALQQYITNSISELKVSIQYYNLLVSFLHDFFADQFKIIDYGTDKVSIEYKDGGDPSQQKMIPLVRSFNIDGGVEQIPKTEFGVYINRGAIENKYITNPNAISNRTAIVSDLLNIVKNAPQPSVNVTTIAGINIPIPTENLDIYFQKNIENCLDYVIQNCVYYRKMHPDIKKRFDNTYQAVKKALSVNVTTSTTLSTAASIAGNLLFSSTTAAGFAQAAAQSVLDYYKLDDDKVSVNYLNENGIDSFGVISEKTILLNTIIQIDTGKIRN
jgi:hypothetical protein